MKTILVVLLLVAVAGLGLTAWQQSVRAAAARAEAAALEAQRDSIMADVGKAVLKADSAQEVLDSLEAVRLREKAVSEAQAMRLQAQADSLQQHIGELMPPELVDREVAEAVMGAVQEIRLAHAQEVDQLTGQLMRTENLLAREREQVERKQRINDGLRQSMALAEEEVGFWKDAANPGLLKRLKQDAGLLGTAAALGGVVVLAFTGGGH